MYYLIPLTLDYLKVNIEREIKKFSKYTLFSTFLIFPTGLSVEDVSTLLFADDWEKQDEESLARSSRAISHCIH